MKNKDQLYELYLNGFPFDSREFAEFFVDSVPCNNIITISENQQIISVGYIIEKSAHLFGKDTKISYLSALSTRDDYRKRGKMRLVIEKAFFLLFERGQSFAFLNPFDENYYKQFDFETIAFCQKSKITGKNQFEIRIATNDDTPILQRIYNSNSEIYDNYLIKSTEDIKQLLQGFAVDNNVCRIIFDGRNPFAFYFSSKQSIEYYATSQQMTFQSVGALEGLGYEQPSSSGEAYIQARIINAKLALLEYNYNKSIEGIYRFTIIDNILPQNNIDIILQISKGFAVPSTKVPQSTFCYDIMELARKMFLGGDLFDKSSTLFIDKY